MEKQDFDVMKACAAYDEDELAKSIAENVLDDRFSIRVSKCDEEVNKNLFCVEVYIS